MVGGQISAERLWQSAVGHSRKDKETETNWYTTGVTTRRTGDPFGQRVTRSSCKSTFGADRQRRHEYVTSSPFAENDISRWSGYIQTVAETTTSLESVYRPGCGATHLPEAPQIGAGVDRAPRSISPAEPKRNSANRTLNGETS